LFWSSGLPGDVLDFGEVSGFGDFSGSGFSFAFSLGVGSGL
jgi:hypothetical protein